MSGKSIYFIILSMVIFGCRSGKPKLEKIIFHTSLCFGECSVYHLEVKNNKAVRLYAETVFKNTGKFNYQNDIDKEGYFVGKATDANFRRLDSIIQNIGIDTLKFNDLNCCDGVLYTIIVYYDGKKKILKSMFPPEKANDLISTLYSICKESNVMRTDDGFEIEGSM